MFFKKLRLDSCHIPPSIVRAVKHEYKINKGLKKLYRFSNMRFYLAELFIFSTNKDTHLLNCCKIRIGYQLLWNNIHCQYSL